MNYTEGYFDIWAVLYINPNAFNIVDFTTSIMLAKL